MSSTPTASTVASATTTFIAADYSTEPNFQGWYLQTTPQPIVCGTTETYYTSDSYGGCYNPATSYPMPTGCDAETLLYNDDSYGVCATSYSCSSYTVFPTEGAPVTDAVYVYECFMNWAANSIYRTLPTRYDSATVATATSETMTSPSPTGTKDHHTATSTSTSTSITTTSKPTSTGTSSSSNSSSSSSGLSGGAIGGIVVGCAAAIIIVLLLVFRRKIMACLGRKPANGDGPAWSPVYNPPQTQSVAQSSSARGASEMESEWQASEMSSEAGAIHEIGTSSVRPQVIHEMS